jgi:hypothetical protein
MRDRWIRTAIVTAVCLSTAGVAAGRTHVPLPVSGLYLGAPRPDEVAMTVQFIRKVLPKEKVNVLVMEFDYGYQFKSHPEVGDPSGLSKQDVEAIAAACRAAGVRLIPLINMLGHQSWKQYNGGLLKAHPELDETPGKYPHNEGIYCRSYCPLHPEVHKIVFDLIDELADACQADAVHVGMDEVFILADPDCPRCRNHDPAELFAGEVQALHDHLAATKREMWMWGDRFLDGKLTGLGEWEASENGTAAAIRLVPRDVVICDWHYDSSPSTAAYFAVQGFRVLSAPWRDTQVALGQLDLIRSSRTYADKTVAPRMLGVLQTTWGRSSDFIRAYKKPRSAPVRSAEAARTFRKLFKKIRSMR